jgi:hypothetical protein
VYAVSLRDGHLVGALGIAGHDLCSDTKGNVFVPTSGYQIIEYSHDGQQIQTLMDGDVPLGCAVDPETGDLAVTNEASGAGEIAIFPESQGPPQYYRDPVIATYGLCGYDDRGNLFVDGFGSQSVLAELPQGSAKFINFTLGSQFVPFGDVAWDGRHITVSNPSTDTVFRLRISKSLKVVGSTHLKSWDNSYSGHWPYIQTSLDERRFIAQNSMGADIGLWRYPKGGAPKKSIGPFKSGDVNIYGIVVSVAPN